MKIIASYLFIFIIVQW